MNVFTSNALPPKSNMIRGKGDIPAAKSLKAGQEVVKSDDAPSLRTKNLSEDEIREKIKEMENKKKNSYGQLSKGNNKSEVEGTHEGKAPGDLSNDPRDPATIGKLKDALSGGTFPFSEKEREVLGKILEG